MKRKIIIVTNFGKTINYGAILQAYALNKYLSLQGFDCKTLNYIPGLDRGSIIRYAKHHPIRALKALKSRILRFIINKKLKIRSKIFEKFKNENIPHTKACTGESVLSVVNSEDILICGSDQIWRPGLSSNLFDDVYWLLPFKNKIKISYAASIGVNSFSDIQKNYAKNALDGFKSISVREMSSLKLLEALTYRKIELAADPVFLIERSSWINFTASNTVSKKFIFVYFISPNRRIYSNIYKTAKKKGLEIISFPYMGNQFNFSDLFMKSTKISNASPQDFLSYILNSEYIFTDSFHCTAFSIIFNKNFKVYITNHGTRLDNLLKITEFSDRVIKNAVIIMDKIDNNRWANSNKIIKEYKEKSKSFLFDSLSEE